MAWSIDARVPVQFGTLEDAAAEDALLVEGDGGVGTFLPAQGHPAACACCAGRSPAAAALDTLFQRRARGEIPFFRRVVAVTSSPEGDLEVWTALRSDPVVAARFRPYSGTS